MPPPTAGPWQAYGQVPPGQAPFYGQPQPYGVYGQPQPYGAYTAPVSPLAPSGMRRLSGLFKDIGTILRRAWAQILLTGLAIWVAWLIVAGVLSALLIDFGAFGAAVDYSSDVLGGNNSLTLAEQHELNELWSQVLRIDSPAIWILFFLVLLLLAVFAAAYQLAVASQLGIDAASGRTVDWRLAMSRGWRAGWRLTGYLVVLYAAVIAVFLVWGLLIGLAAAANNAGVTALVVLISIVLFVGIFVVMVWLVGRLIPVVVQVLFEGPAISWSWQASCNKYWAILGRYLLWAMIASVIISTVLQVVFTLLFFAVAASFQSSPTALGVVTIIVFGIYILLSMVLNAAAYIGVVPIWRDLTDLPEYRSIDEDGLPISS